MGGGDRIALKNRGCIFLLFLDIILIEKVCLSFFGLFGLVIKQYHKIEHSFSFFVY